MDKPFKKTFFFFNANIPCLCLVWAMTAAAVVLGCASDPHVATPDKKAAEKPLTVGNPHDWVQSREEYFKKEWQAINKRRGLVDAPGRPPEKCIGLALSGGGIRSNAFSLGILAGLHEKGLLRHIDYLSSVSGGSWGAAAYIFSKSDDASFFKELEGPERKFLPVKQGEFLREQWRKNIVEKFLPDYVDSPLYYEDLVGLDHLDIKKPYFIINATHSADVWETPKVTNFNIQFTRDAVSAVADCDSESKDGDFCNFWQEFPWRIPTAGGMGKGFHIPNSPKDYVFHINTWPNPYDYRKKLRVSDILVASSAVVTKAYGSFIRVQKQNGNAKSWYRRNDLRDKYRLSDGGKSENTGALALMERGVNLVIVSQIAQDEKMEFKDLELLNDQLKRFFNMGFDKEDIREQIKSQKKAYAITLYGNLDPQGKVLKDENKKIVFIKPTVENIECFRCWLKKNLYFDELKAINKDLEDAIKMFFDPCHFSRFPQNPTFCFKYEYDIITAYYLLGKYTIINQGVGKIIENYRLKF